MDVSENSGTPKSSILIGFSIQPSILGYPYFWKHPNEDLLSRSLRNREEISALDLSVETMEPMNFRCVSDGRPQLKKKYPTNRIHGTKGIEKPTFWLIFVVNVGESTLHGSYGYCWFGVSYGGLHPRKSTWIPTNMMVWRMQLVSNIAIFGVYVHFWGVCWCLVYEPIY